VLQQFRYRYFSSFDWPTNFERVNQLAWLAVLLLVADVVVEVLRRRRAANEDQGALSEGALPSVTESMVP
jgi:uncharacterized membrane protein